MFVVVVIGLWVFLEVWNGSGARLGKMHMRDLIRLTVWAALGLALSLETMVAKEQALFGAPLGKLVYESRMDSPQSVADWKMEGPGKLVFEDGWMRMFSPGEEMHHVFWCPQELPERFAATWEMQNRKLEAGLCIVFFAATGLEGQDVMDPGLPERDGTFSQYNNDQLKNYHISYYAHNPKLPNREVARLRKNPGKQIVYEGPRGISVESKAVHKVTLIKDGAHVRLYVDNRRIIDWKDQGEVLGGAYGAGKIALRQMQWTHFRYRNFKAWALE